ncbi:interleukin-15 isoform X2 [Gymnodraco acuticeps]|uniref:Interleukin-15 n=1 Tax=Gymnodraco acuticeps TaxID=8218 RepID=A0A6P8VP21_GYMAC|nr:interleukin-15 isoform X2 [Gymnodraco acuticeps]
MIDFMTAFPVILIQPTCPGDLRAKGIQFQSTCNLCRESHKTQVWLCFLVLSFLSTSPCAASLPDTQDLQGCFDVLREAIKNSDAMLYAPNEVINDAEECKLMLLKCYMLELLMVIHEEEIRTHEADVFFEFNAGFHPEHDGCQRPCESYPLVNITRFSERLKSFLQEMNSRMT